jgi:hypothetical protein
VAMIEQGRKMKLTKEQWLNLDEIKNLKGYQVLKDYIKGEKENILKILTSIKSYEVISQDGVKVIHSADNQLYEIRGRLSAFDLIINLVESAYKKSKEK